MVGWFLSGRQVGWSRHKISEAMIEEFKATNLVHVVMDVLASNDWCDRVSLLGRPLCTGTLELCTLLLEASFDGFWITMLMLTVLHRDDVMLMLLGKNFAVLDRLHRSMVMVLMDLTINGCRGLFVADFANFFFHNGWGDLLVHCGVMVAGLVP